MKCLICEKELKSLPKHMRWHYEGPSPTLQYCQEFLFDFDICELYQQGMSLNEIGEKCKIAAPFASHQKCELSLYVKSKGLTIRSTSDAMKSYFSNNDVWNKSLTKDDHPSIMRSSIRNMGKGNFIFKLTEQERKDKIFYWLFKSKDELKVIRNKISQTLIDGYASGKIIHISESDPEKFRNNILSRMLEGWRQAHIDGRVKVIRCSSHETRIADALVENEVKFIRQKRFAGRRFHYDFYLQELSLIIEVNGDYWHCNPKDYVPEYLNPSKNMLASEIWDFDAVKIENANQVGCKVLTVWECKINELDPKQLTKFVSEILQDTKDNKSFNRQGENAKRARF